MTNTIAKMLDDDINKTDKLIHDYPNIAPVAVIADFLGTQPANIRAAIECGSFGFVHGVKKENVLKRTVFRQHSLSDGILTSISLKKSMHSLLNETE